jgi:hypothetical protein
VFAQQVAAQAPDRNFESRAAASLTSLPFALHASRIDAGRNTALAPAWLPGFAVPTMVRIASQ